MPYIYKKQNYLLKIKNDLNFLQYTKLINYFNISTKSDPFLLVLTKQINNNDSKDINGNKIVHFITA